MRRFAANAGKRSVQGMQFAWGIKEIHADRRISEDSIK
jgi:hypothetical protein